MLTPQTTIEAPNADLSVLGAAMLAAASTLAATAQIPDPCITLDTRVGVGQAQGPLVVNGKIRRPA
jgi:hypothetical protein